jgi:hypothetical protein
MQLRVKGVLQQAFETSLSLAFDNSIFLFHPQPTPPWLVPITLRVPDLTCLFERPQADAFSCSVGIKTQRVGQRRFCQPKTNPILLMKLVALRRFQEAIVAGKKAQRHCPFFGPAYRCLASAFAHLGRDAEAREAAARVLEFDPAFTISAFAASRLLKKVLAADWRP